MKLNINIMIADNVVHALRATWKAQKAKLKERFPDLTKVDLDFKESEQNEMFDKLQNKLGLSPNDIQVIALS